MTESKIDSAVLERLYAVIESRRGDDPEESYTARLFRGGAPQIAKKVGEEAAETVVAALSGDSADLAAESADLLYHLLVLWADCGVRPADVWAELERREGTSGIAEKRARKTS